ncbi:hypothetical protein [Paracoccus actinidiae]|uniref:hypothetical protein n=1 Tax=Paracoccus actinidiae TaxID=3064531 RepID=UPI0027D29E01|nr:hypothetical protein [Paracoccus sp. M09]
MLLCLAAIVAGTIWNLDQLAVRGELSENRRDLQSLAVGLAVCLLAVLAMPRIAALSWIGPPSFTIYLYHVLGTASVREALYSMGLTSVPLNYAAGIASGIGLHLLVSQSKALRGSVLGLWRQPRTVHKLARECAQSLRASGNRSAQDR